jgi:hypothetical protein
VLSAGLARPVSFEGDLRQNERGVISSTISRVSATLLAAGGLALLFASDEVLPRVSPGFPATAHWIGQLLGAAWLGLAALNWIHRRAVLGGVYGRPIVMANLMHYFIAALALVRASIDGTPGRIWPLALPAITLALAYGALLLRGPFDAP